MQLLLLYFCSNHFKKQASKAHTKPHDLCKKKSGKESPSSEWTQPGTPGLVRSTGMSFHPCSPSYTSFSRVGQPTTAHTPGRSPVSSSTLSYPMETQALHRGEPPPTTATVSLRTPEIKQLSYNYLLPSPCAFSCMFVSTPHLY
jgi:hypothetical protein